MADSSRFTAKIYRLRSLTLGSGCVIRDVEVAVFPNATRPILGLSALQKLTPFIFSINPPVLALSNCESRIGATDEILVPPISLK